MENIDELTQLYNMRYFRENYDKFFTEHQDAKLISIDFTSFKYINDNYGHQAGDNCLKFFSKTAEEVFFDGLVIRRGGDEFLILANGSNEEIENNLNKIRDFIKSYFTLNLIPVAFNFNAGVVNAEHGIDSSMEKSDITMYDAKKKNELIAFFNKTTFLEAKEKDLYIERINKLIDEKDITYAGKEIVDMSLNRSGLVDVYSRNNNNKPFITPKYYDYLREAYVLKKLDYYNLREIILKTSEVMDESLILNIHSQTLLSKDIDFKKFIVALCNVTDVSNGKYVMCINVDTLGDEWESVIPKIEFLKQLGFKIALANLSFIGTSSAISIWSKTNIDYIKISSSVWKEAMKNPKNEFILRGLIPAFHDGRTQSIFMKVENRRDIEFIHSVNSNALMTGNAFGAEKKLIIN